MDTFKQIKCKRVKYNGKIVDTITIGQLALMCNRKVITMRKLEDRNILPLPSLRFKNKFKRNGDEILGNRLYSYSLALRIAEIFKDVTQGVKINNEQRRQIALAFQEELIFINS